MEQNRGVKYSRLLFLKGLLDFEAAELEPNPIMIWEVDWETVKKNITLEVKQIAREIC